MPPVLTSVFTCMIRSPPPGRASAGPRSRDRRRPGCLCSGGRRPPMRWESPTPIQTLHPDARKKAPLAGLLLAVAQHLAHGDGVAALVEGDLGHVAAHQQQATAAGAFTVLRGGGV